MFKFCYYICRADEIASLVLELISCALVTNVTLPLPLYNIFVPDCPSHASNESVLLVPSDNIISGWQVAFWQRPILLAALSLPTGSEKPHWAV